MAGVAELFIEHHPENWVSRCPLWMRAGVFLVLLPASIIVADGPWLGVIGVYIAVILASSARIRPSSIKRFLGGLAVLTGSILVLSAAFSTGPWDTKLRIAGLVVGRLVGLVGSGFLFVSSTDPIEIPLGLIRIGIPHRLGIALMVAQRFVPLLSSRLDTIILCQRTRGARFSVRSLNRLPQELASLMIPVVSTALEASVGMTDTLITRGYDPQAPTLTRPPRPDTRARAWILFVSGILLATAVFVAFLMEKG